MHVFACNVPNLVHRSFRLSPLYWSQVIVGCITNESSFSSKYIKEKKIIDNI